MYPHRRLLFALVLCMPLGMCADDLEQVIDEEVYRELSHHLNVTRQRNRVSRDIDREVRHTLAHEHTKKRRQNQKERLGRNIKLHFPKKKKEEDFFYKIPSWPFRSTFYVEKDLVEVAYEGVFATKSYSSGGSSQDISKLIFTEDTIAVKDILLVSTLLREGKLDALSAVPPTPQSHYFYLIANQALDFHASTDIQKVVLRYARHFHKDDISFVLSVPIVHRKNKLKLTSEIASSLREELKSATPNFYGTYDDLEDFFLNILKNRDTEIRFNTDDSESGIGDIEAALNVEFNTRLFERCVMGMTAFFPTANDTVTGKLWHPQLGNGGFIELALFAGLLKSLYQWVNPHVYLQVGVSLPRSVERRVPTKRTYDGVSPTPGTEVGANLTLGGTEVHFKSAYDAFDVKYRGFANEVKSVRLRPGPKMQLMIGNTIENVFSQRAFLDLFYEGFFKGADYVGGAKNDSTTNTEVLTDNTYEMRHTIGSRFVYFFDTRKQLKGGVTFPLAGRNTLKSIDVYASFNLQF